MKRIPEYKRMPAEKLPPYQLYKRWQKATGYESMDKFGTISGEQMLSDINAESRAFGILGNNTPQGTR